MGLLPTYPNPAPWYQNQAKPAFNPPKWLFAPVWTAMYALTIYAGWRIPRFPVGTPGRRTALVLFFVQLALNAAWSWMFFGLNNPLAYLLNIIPL